MTVSKGNTSIGDNGSLIPESSTQVGGSDGTNLQTPRVFDADTGVGEQYVLGAILRASALGGSVEAGTTANPLRTDPVGTTPQPISGTVTADQGTPAALADKWPVQVTDGTNVMPTMDVAARAGFEKITDGTNTAAVKAASTAPAATDPALVVTLSPNSSLPTGINTTATGALAALNDVVTVAVAGQQSVGFQLAIGTLVGTIVPELSFDGGTTWNATFFDDANSILTGSIVFAATNTAQARSITVMGGATHARVRVSAFTGGTATLTLNATQAEDATAILSSTSATGDLGALNAFVSVSLAGQGGVGFQLSAGTLSGTIIPELSFDGGATWNAASFVDSNSALGASIVFTAANTAQSRTIAMQGGATHARVKVSAFTSGTASILLSATQGVDATVINATAVATGTLNVLSAAVTVSVSGQQSVGFQLAAGTLIGTIVPELSFDGGTTWSAAYFDDVNSALTTSIVFSIANTAQVRSISVQGGATHARVRVSAFTSGTATLTLNATQGNDATIVLASTSATGSLGALDAAVSVNIAGQASVGFQLAAGSLIGSISPELSFDGGVTWNATFFDDGNSALTTGITFAVANTAQARSIVVQGGATQARVRVNLFTSGTAAITLNAAQGIDATTTLSSTAATGALNALNAAVTVLAAGQASVGFQLSAGTLIGTIVPELSFDGGVTFNAAFFVDSNSYRSSSVVFSAANTAQSRTIAMQGGATHARVRVSAFTSGTASLTISAVQGVDATVVVASATAVGALNALNAAVTTLVSGQASIGFQLAAGTLIGTIVPELSFDGGVTFSAAFFDNVNSALTTSIVFAIANSAQVRSIAVQGGATHARVRVSAFTSGTANLTISATHGLDATTTLSSTSATGALNALNANVTVLAAGQRSVGFQLSAGTLIGTIIPELSFDGGTTFNAAFFDDVNSALTTSIVFAAANTAQARTISMMGGATHARVRVSVFTSGTANLTIGASQAVDATVVAAPTDGFKRTYSANVLGLVPPATPTDIFSITGIAGTVVRVIRITITGTRTAASVSDMQVVKRSTANAGGTSAAATAVPNDSQFPAAGATVLSYTANPAALGTLVGAVASSKIHIGSAGSGPVSPLVFEFGKKMGASGILRTASEVFAVNMNAVTIAGNNFDIFVEWTEEPA